MYHTLIISFLFGSFFASNGFAQSTILINRHCVVDALREGLGVRDSVFGTINSNIQHLRDRYFAPHSIDYLEEIKEFYVLKKKLRKNSQLSPEEIMQFTTLHEKLEKTESEIALKTQTLLGEFGIPSVIQKGVDRHPYIGMRPHYFIEIISGGKSVQKHEHWLKKLAFGLHRNQNKIVFDTRFFLGGAQYLPEERLVISDFGSLFAGSPTLYLRHELTHYAVAQLALKANNGVFPKNPIFRRTIMITKPDGSPLFRADSALRGTTYENLFYLDEVDAHLSELSAVNWLLKQNRPFTSQELHHLQRTMNSIQEFINESRNHLLTAKNKGFKLEIDPKDHFLDPMINQKIRLHDGTHIYFNKSQFSNGVFNEQSVLSAIEDELRHLNEQEKTLKQIEEKLEPFRYRR